jgi:predicted transposase YbfD/YdcC
MSGQPALSFLSHFAALDDPRQAAKVLYPLPEILLLLLCATIAGAHGCAAIDPVAFKTCFEAWVETLRAKDPAIIAVDGKTSRRSHDRRKGRMALHTVSAWATGQRLVLGQEATEEKSNEITAIPRLLHRLDLHGALVTIDAMGTQTAIAQAILDGGGDYVLALKENWPATHAAVAQVFADAPADLAIQRSQTIDADHGRIETRTHAVCHHVDWLFSDRRHPGEFRFPGLAAIGMVESETERGGALERERRFYLCSTRLDAETFGRVVRGHWGIENRLHWVLDVVFRDDLARLRSGNGPANMAVIKHTALNMLNQAKPNTSLKNRRKRAGWNQDYLARVVQGTA